MSDQDLTCDLCGAPIRAGDEGIICYAPLYSRRKLEARLARAESIIAEQRTAMAFTLSNIFDPPNGWYSDDVFPDMPGTPEEQIEAGRDPGPAYVSHARARLRAALALTLYEGQKP